MSINIVDANTPSESPEASSSGSSTGEDWESGEFFIQRPKQRKNVKNKVKTNVIATTKQAQQFKAKSSHIKITGNSNSLKKQLTNMRSEPDFCEALAKNVNLLRPTRQALDSVENDYYSQICDNQLSVGSPCSQYLRSPDDWRSSCKVLVVAKPVESQSIGFKVDDKNVRKLESKNPTTHRRHNLQSNDEPPTIKVTQSPSLPMHSHSASITAISVDTVAPPAVPPSNYSPLYSKKKKVQPLPPPASALSNDMCADGFHPITGDEFRAIGRISNNNNNNNTSNKRFTFRDFRKELQSVIRQNSSSKH